VAELAVEYMQFLGHVATQGRWSLVDVNYLEVLTLPIGTNLNSENMPLNEHDKDLIQAMFYDDCDVNTVAAIVRHAPRSTLYRMQKNIELFGQVRRPSSALKQRGAPREITPIMREYLIDLLLERNDLWQEGLVFESWCQFDIAVNKSTICRLLKEQELTNKVNTRIASRQSSAQQGVYLEQLSTLIGQGLNAGIEPMDMLVYLDESACSEKVMFRRRS
jgi:transposase